MYLYNVYILYIYILYKLYIHVSEGSLFFHCSQEKLKDFIVRWGADDPTFQGSGDESSGCRAGLKIREINDISMEHGDIKRIDMT